MALPVTGLHNRTSHRFLKSGKIQEQIKYGLTNLTQEAITPLQLLGKPRSYWGIENGLHYTALAVGVGVAGKEL